MHKCKEKLGCSGTNIQTYSKDKNLTYELCRDCCLIWRSADSMQLSKTYEEVYFDSKNYKNKRKHKVKKSGWLIDLARLKNRQLSSLLEVGCSLGYTLEAAQKRGIEHLGIDISKYAVQTCKELGLNALNLSLGELKLRDKKFDLIFMQHVLEHFENPFSTLKACSDLLKDDGMVLILVPNSKFRSAVKKKEEHRFYSKKGVGLEHFVYFNYINLNAVLSVSGFEIVQQNYPVFISRYLSPEFFYNRLFRRLLSVFHLDQELMIIARKIKKQ